METTEEIEPTIEAVVGNIIGHSVAARVSADTVHVEPYGYDDRCGWDVHLVTIDGYGVYGMTDGPLFETVEG